MCVRKWNTITLDWPGKSSNCSLVSMRIKLITCRSNMTMLWLHGRYFTTQPAWSNTLPSSNDSPNRSNWNILTPIKMCAFTTTQLKIFGRDTGGRSREMVEHKAENWQSLGSSDRVALVECPLFGRDSAVNLYLSSAKYLPKIVRLLFLQ